MKLPRSRAGGGLGGSKAKGKQENVQTSKPVQDPVGASGSHLRLSISLQYPTEAARNGLLMLIIDVYEVPSRHSHIL